VLACFYINIYIYIFSTVNNPHTHDIQAAEFMVKSSFIKCDDVLSFIYSTYRAQHKRIISGSSSKQTHR
jgi:hypothetical protein